MDKPTPTTSASPKKDTTFAILAHLGGILFGFIPALVLFLIKKSEPNSEFETEHAKEALNFQITITIAWFASFFLSIILIGFLLMPPIFLGNLIFCILAAVKASNGEYYRYPLTLRLIK